MRTHVLAVAAVAGIAGLLVVGAFGGTRLLAQNVQAAQASAAMPEFEAASVKPNKSGGNSTNFGFQAGGRFNATNITLRTLIAAAYGAPQPLPLFEVLGGPNWLDSDRFDIVAKAAGDPQPGPNGPPPELVLMMRQLLADRFHVVVHNETRDLPVYALVMARPDGKMGDHFHTSVIDCAALMAAGRGGPPVAPTPGGPFCGTRGAPGRLNGSGSTMAMLANNLSRLVSRVVMERTGLNGSFDFELEWTPDQMPAASADAPRPGALPPPPSDGPSIFTAVQEQLGLKLDSTRGPVNVVVIDHVEQPTED